MNIFKYKYLFILIPLFASPIVFWLFHETKTQNQEVSVTKQTLQKTDSIPLNLKRLQKAYSNFIVKLDSNSIEWKDGTKMLYDAAKKYANYEDRLNNADLKAQMTDIYTKGETYEIPKENFDPGRVRSEAFFKKMYGATQQEVRKHLVAIKWLPRTLNKTLLITSINGVDKQLQAVSNELEQHPELLKYIDFPAGTFNWRTIEGTKRLSMHSFGIAIDINVKYSDYWRWNKSPKYTNRIPLAIVIIFEKHGFIWGGKWAHFDTMHFEYRPELLSD